MDGMCVGRQTDHMATDNERIGRTPEQRVENRIPRITHVFGSSWLGEPAG
jgi:hypothetical protein